MLTSFEEDYPDDPEVITARGHWYFAQQEFTEGSELFELAHQLQNSSDSLNTLFRAYRTTNRLEEGVEVLRVWLEKNPEDYLVRHTLAQAYVAKNDLDNARITYERLRESDPDSILILNSLAAIYQRLADPRALETARAAYEQAPDTPSVLDTYGWILTESGNPEQGLPLLSEAFARKSTGAEVRYHFGLALMKVGREEATAKEIAASLEQNEWFYDMEKAKLLLGDLKAQVGGI